MIELEDKFRVGISIINEGHKDFIGIIKAIIVNEHNDNTEATKDILGDMLECSHKHFSKEEACMVMFKFPEYRLHRKEHLSFISKTVMSYHNLIDANYQISNEILENLKNWLVIHIQVSDKKYVNFFNENYKGWQHRDMPKRRQQKERRTT